VQQQQQQQQQMKSTHIQVGFSAQASRPLHPCLPVLIFVHARCYIHCRHPRALLWISIGERGAASRCHQQQVIISSYPLPHPCLPSPGFPGLRMVIRTDPCGLMIRKCTALQSQCPPAPPRCWCPEKDLKCMPL
jgi:hypothetical protein